MKLRVLYSIILLHIISLTYSQNWAVFNKNYRYNYSLENESYTTVVIFADSTLTQGVDTIYSLNRIAAKCDSCWFYYPEPGVADSNYILINQPQFMQRRIIYSNNQYRLSDTSEYIIPRFLSVGNSWTYNLQRGITAQVISASIKNYFGVSDSVNTILLNTNDTIIISKQFGIVKYPAKFGQNVYYKLRGIENKFDYNLLSLYGEKVPNYYDFFKLKPGVIHYYSTTSSASGTTNLCYAYYYAKKLVTSSTIMGDTIYNSSIEDRKGCWGGCSSGWGGYCLISNPSIFPSISTTTYTFNNVPTLPQFWDHYYTAYNNQIIFWAGVNLNVYIVKFGKTTNNHFYKTYGYSCFSGYLSELKPEYSNCYYTQSSQNPEVFYAIGITANDFTANGETFIEGYGEVNQFLPEFEGQSFYCTSTIIDGTDTLGEIIPYGIYTDINVIRNNSYSSFGPNPTKDITTIYFPFETTDNSGVLEINDVYGKNIFQKPIPSGASSENINLQNFAPGIYFVNVKIPHYQKQYKVIKD